MGFKRGEKMVRDKRDERYITQFNDTWNKCVRVSVCQW
jgi:hypothetical protein